MGGRLGRAFWLLIDGYLDGNAYPFGSVNYHRGSSDLSLTDAGVHTGTHHLYEGLAECPAPSKGRRPVLPALTSSLWACCHQMSNLTRYPARPPNPP